MYRTLALCLVVACWFGPAPILRAGDAPALKALQEATQKAIEQAEPSIACILVSRSDLYQRFGFAPDSEDTGKLGGFDPAAWKATSAVAMLTKEQLAKLLKKLDLADPDNIPPSYGSGIVIDEQEGLLLTNYHVVRGATKIFVRLPGNKSSYADIHAADARSDLAILALHKHDLGMKALKLGDAGKVKKGQFVVSIANPYAAGFRDGEPSASWGIISNIRRRAPNTAKEEDRAKLTLHHFGTLLQTDARLNLGCSGGALIDLKGRLIGLTSALAAIRGTETPGGYAIPLDRGMAQIIEVLKKGEVVEYAFLGIATKKVLGTKGLVITSVMDGSPANLAGLKEADVLLTLNDVPLHDGDDLSLALGTLLAGSKVSIEYRRPSVSAQIKSVEATLAKLYVPGKSIASRKRDFRGIRVEYTSVFIQRRISKGLQKIPAGVWVNEILPGSPAATALLKPGEILITHVNGQAVNSPAEFFNRVKGLSGAAELTLVSASNLQSLPKVTIN
jgi:S1-C subfamily serine protease